MKNKEKLLQKFCKNPTSLKFLEIEKLLFGLGFEKRNGKGSYLIFWHKELVEPLVFSIHQKDCKNYQKKEVLKILIALNLVQK